MNEHTVEVRGTAAGRWRVYSHGKATTSTAATEERADALAAAVTPETCARCLPVPPCPRCDKPVKRRGWCRACSLESWRGSQ